MLYAVFSISSDSLICILSLLSSPFSFLQHLWQPLSTHLFFTLPELYLFLSQPLSIHVKVSCLLWHFCLFLCVCLTPYSCLMYLSHFQKQCCQSSPRKLDWTALVETMANLINHRGNQSWGSTPFSSSLISSALICSPSREGDEQGSRDVSSVFVCMHTLVHAKGMQKWVIKGTVITKTEISWI